MADSLVSFWSELFDHMAGSKPPLRDSIFLSFDDGYLDNWTYVFPILKKYGMKATIFVSPDFVDPTETVRPNLDDQHAGRCTSEDLSPAGFLSWG